jgi:hypothetical protein
VKSGAFDPTPTPSFVCRKTMGSSPVFHSVGRF